MNPKITVWLTFLSLLLAQLVHGDSQFFTGSSAASSTSATGSTTSYTQTSSSVTTSTSSGSSTSTTTSSSKDDGGSKTVVAGEEDEGGSKVVIAGTDDEGTTAVAGSTVVAPPGQTAVAVARSVVTNQGATTGAVAATDDEAIGVGVDTPASIDDDVLEETGMVPAAEGAVQMLPFEEGIIIPEELDLCQGLAKFKCCDDREFVADGSDLFCGCWGSDIAQGCSFKVLEKEVPYVVQDLTTPQTQVCRCQEPLEEVQEECFGRTKVSCCDEVEPDATACRCLIGDTCIYTKRADGVWHNTWFVDSDCVCPE